VDAEQTWQVIRSERLRLADALQNLTPQQWSADSLCEGWSVRDVAAHLTCVSEPPSVGALVVAGVQARGSFHRLNTVVTKNRARRPTQALVASQREHAGSRKIPVVSNQQNVLFDLLVHMQDVAIPLGLDLPMPVEAARQGASRVWEMGWPFAAQRRLRGLRLTATDVEWSVGDGDDVRGPIEALLLLLTGRPAALPHLSGAGLARVTTALAPRVGA
jgi:uncharacterized protein (TIGR03083 family)